jgi:glycerophosphoryl diester phosphodiesterase
MKHKEFPNIHAHRGFAEEAPESTLSAFKLAVENGADGVEFDLHYIRDRKIMVHHDSYLGRTSNGAGYISDKTYKELYGLDAGTWFSDKYKGEKIPLFSEALELLKDKCKLEVQLVTLSEDFIHDVLDMIVQRKMLHQVEITSSYPQILMKVRQYHPTIKIGVFLPEDQWKQDDLWCINAIRNMRLIGADVAHIPNYRLNEHNVMKVKNSGYVVHASDCNDLEHLRKAVDYGVHQLSTDKLKQALNFKKRMQEL